MPVALLIQQFPTACWFHWNWSILLYLKIHCEPSFCSAGQYESIEAEFCSVFQQLPFAHFMI